MTDRQDIERYAGDPKALVKLCRDVVQQLMAGQSRGDLRHKKAQLQQIANAIEQLERARVPVPDSLRAEKTRLAAELAQSTDTTASLRLLAGEFQNISKEIKDSLGYSAVPGPRPPRPRGPRGDANQTPPSTLKQYLLETLAELGGAANCSEVLDIMEQKLEDKFLPGDMEFDQQHKTKWRHNAHWVRLNLVHDGILKSNSPRGIWELNN